MFVTPAQLSNADIPKALNKAKNYTIAYSINAFALSLIFGATGGTLWGGAAFLLLGEKKLIDAIIHQIYKCFEPIQAIFNFAQDCMGELWDMPMLKPENLEVITDAAPFVAPVVMGGESVLAEVDFDVTNQNISDKAPVMDDLSKLQVDDKMREVEANGEALQDVSEQPETQNFNQINEEGKLKHTQLHTDPFADEVDDMQHSTEAEPNQLEQAYEEVEQDFEAKGDVLQDSSEQIADSNANGSLEIDGDDDAGLDLFENGADFSDMYDGALYDFSFSQLLGELFSDTTWIEEFANEGGFAEELANDGGWTAEFFAEAAEFGEMAGELMEAAGEEAFL